MTSQTMVEPALRPVEGGDADVVHGYPPPVRPPGETVVAYCGALMTVRGESSDSPPSDTCEECVAIWRHQRRMTR